VLPLSQRFYEQKVSSFGFLSPNCEGQEVRKCSCHFPCNSMEHYTWIDFKGVFPFNKVQDVRAVNLSRARHAAAVCIQCLSRYHSQPLRSSGTE